MKRANLLVVIAVLGVATGLNLWGHRAVSDVRAETVRLLAEAERTRVDLLKNQEQTRAAREQMDALNEELTRLQSTADASKPSAGSLSDNTPMGEGRWGTRASFVDLPKTLVTNFQLLIVDGQFEITSEAATLFGLSVEDRQAIRGMYTNIGARVRDLERKHVERSEQHVKAAADREGAKISFVLHPLSAEMEALKAEWRHGLEELVGPFRSELLSRSIGRRVSPSLMRFQNAARTPDMFRTPASWLQSSGGEERVTFVFGERDGKPVQFGYTEGPGDSTSGGSGPNFIPPRWKHLVTQEMLTAARGK